MRPIFATWVRKKRFLIINLSDTSVITFKNPMKTHLVLCLRGEDVLFDLKQGKREQTMNSIDLSHLLAPHHLSRQTAIQPLLPRLHTYTEQKKRRSRIDEDCLETRVQ